MKTAQEMSKFLAEIYEKRFGGKARGRFQISRTAFRKLAGRTNLRDAFIDEVSEQALELGYILISVGDYIAVIKKVVLRNYRKVPKLILNQYLEDDDDESDYKKGEDDDDD